MGAQHDRCIVFLIWGEQALDECLACLHHSPQLAAYPVYILTDRPITRDLPPYAQARVITYKLAGNLRKSELLIHLPQGYDTYLFLDTDVRVLGPIEFGFTQAERFGIAITPAPDYNLGASWGFDAVMQEENVSRLAQLQYNSGVIFFALTAEVKAVFARWHYLAETYAPIWSIGDQKYLTLAMEQLHFNPYTLSQNYNYRGRGDYICGDVIIWHSRDPVPPNLNDYPQPWPRRQVIDGEVIYPEYPQKSSKSWSRKKLEQFAAKLLNRFRKSSST